MGLFRREPIHKRLAKELRDAEPPDFAGGVARVTQPWGETAIHGVARPRRWDAVVTAEAPELTGDAVHFVALPDGSLIVDEDVPDGALAPLADAVESAIEPPYRAEAVLRPDGLWGVAARETEVVELGDEVEGDELELVIRDGVKTLVIDGASAFGSVPELEHLGAARADSFAIRAQRLDGDLWEVQIAAL